MGVMSVGDKTRKDIVMADIPGIIEGASEGKGLGYDFLRHIQACKVLLYILSLDESVIFDQDLPDHQKAEFLFQQFEVLRHELELFDPNLTKKQYFVSVSKVDLYSPELIVAIQAVFKEKGQSVLLFSAITKQGIKDLEQKFERVV
jgi:GTP-binding protein